MRRLGILCIAIACLVTGRVRAEVVPCVGDCGGQGAVGINDLILAVNIVLGLAPLDQCPALGSEPVGIAQLIASVNNALCECHACPTPPPVPSATATPTNTPLPTLTPTATPITSSWHEDQIKIPSSNCPQAVVKQLRQQLSTQTEDYVVRELGDVAEVEDASGDTIQAQLDTDGVLSASLSESDSEGSCVVTIDLSWKVSLRRSPSTADYTGEVHTMSCPRMLDCRLKITSRWTRTSAAALVRAAAPGTPRGLAAAVLDAVR